jgi:hypothetical protein
LALIGSQMPNSSALYFQASVILPAAVVMGDGLRCANGGVIRLATRQNVAGSSQFPTGTDPSISVRGMIGAPSTRAYQVWYRNTASFCTPQPYNVTNGVIAIWGP